jgi:hypothetical protein
MKTSALQEMVKQVFGNETLRTQFMACPESVISGFALSDEESRAVISTHQMFMAGNSSLEAAITNKEGWEAPAP